MWCFDAKFWDVNEWIVVRVNRKDFDYNEAYYYSNFYTEATGRIPKLFRQGLKTITIHDGDKPFGGGGKDILVHTLSGERYLDENNWAGGHNLEETLLHEGAHAIH